MGNPDFEIGWPKPVTNARSRSVAGAGVCNVTELPSGWSTTALFLPSDCTVSKIPGLTTVTGIPESVVWLVPTLTVTEVTPGGRPAGTSTTTYSWPGPRLQTTKMGAYSEKEPAVNRTVTSET